MENERKSGTLKKILRVFGIIFSIVLIPALIVGIPVGGAVMGVSSVVSRADIEKKVEDIGLSDIVLEVLEERVLDGVHVEALKDEFLKEVVLSSITKEWVDDVIAEVLVAVYDGSKPRIDIDPFVKELRRGVSRVAENGFRDLYSAWVNDTKSEFFDTEFIHDFWENIEDDLLAEYAVYDVTSLEDLEAAYDRVNGVGAFSDLLDEKMITFEDVWNDEFTEKIDGSINNIAEETEAEINETLNEVVQDKTVRKLFDFFGEMSEKSGLLKIAVYGIVFIAILLLVSCFCFGTAGFVVSAVPLIIGGSLCVVAKVLQQVAFDFINRFLGKEDMLTEFGGEISTAVSSILTPVFTSVLFFGITMIIVGAILIVLAVVFKLIRKGKTEPQV